MKFIQTVVFSFIFSSLLAQDISTFRKDNLFSKSASFQIGYTGNQQTRDSTKVSSNIFIASLRGTISLVGFQMPLHLSYRAGRFGAGFENPFIRLGVSPSYKWVKLHLGHRQMSFSNYSLNGMTFLGAGIELTPGIFRFAAMTGTLQTPNYSQDSLALYAHLIKEFKRKAFGAKIGIETNNIDFNLHFLKSKDKIESNTESSEFFRTIFPPAENLVVGSGLRFKILKKISFQSNIDATILTNNQLSKNDFVNDISNDNVVDILGKFNSVNNTTKAGLAYDGSIQYKTKHFGLGVKYKHIDINYQSFGMHYTQDDVEQYTVDGNVNLFKNKISLFGSFGKQRNNLNNIKRNTSNRNIIQVNGNIQFTKTSGIMGNYTNFAIDQTPGLSVINDTFRITQNTNNLSLSPYYRHVGKIFTYSLTFNYNKNKIKDFSTIETTGREGSNQIISLQFNGDYLPYKLGFNAGINSSNDNFNGSDISRIGGTLGVRKQLLDKKINLNLNTQYNIINNAGKKDGQSFSLQFNAGFNIIKSLNLNLRIGYLNRDVVISRKFSETMYSVNLNYLFFQKK